VANATPDLAGTPATFAVEPAPTESDGAAAYPEDLIRITAYYHYIDREAAGQPGDALGDWVQAEHKVQAA
jgi:hypothetical protein